ncbi:efflux RND transporter periplasmic adaptor subunit [Neotamlana laminarinivorans]|uniref:Efflux RND transporter periplasmic adaptor subunit n=1 Tax=Neotamlana laminarinivorans TaxID=2883124 RepID=A0A9X1HX95_9FLAO|nr:efflux RND transporter periplasmic adaptor subunit [Tamlana laminarinivorans]MCB4797839.1 efflux RND transporter periplasmic adaptor subunit [Tamlana laminarinivorans]
MKKTYIILSLLISILATSCNSKDKKAVANSTPEIPVNVAKVSNNTDGSFLAVSGKIQAKNSANLSTRIMGYVNTVSVNVGDKVKKGQLLVSINNTDLQAKKAQVNANITKATAAFNNAEKDYNRFKSLFTDNSASQKELDDISANYEMAKASLEAAKQMKNEVNAQFAYTNITAPFSGVITNKTVKKGDMANPGMPLISVESLDDFEVIAMVPETEISKIQKGTEVKVNVKAINQIIKGKVTEVSSSAAQTGGQYLTKIILNKTNYNILSGMFTTVQFPVEKESQSSLVLIPKKAIVTNGQLSGVYTVSESNTAILRWLRLGRAFGGDIEVLSGLSANESYIVSAEGKLYNGAKVLIQ